MKNQLAVKILTIKFLKGDENMAKEIDELFTPMLHALHDFMDEEEKNVGCLSKKEHLTTMKIINWFAQLYDAKREREDEPTEKKNAAVQSACIRDDEDEAERSISNSRILEMEI